MKTLPPITPTREQLPLVSSNRLGVDVIRGAAGSGKTSTAILRLRSLLYMMEERFDRLNIDRPVNVLVLTFNRTLRGYVQVLAEEQVKEIKNANLEVNTFARWAMQQLAHPAVVRDSVRESFIRRASAGLQLAAEYVVGEVDYLLGRFEPDDLERYIEVERTGRGAEPRVDRATRRKLLDQVVYPYRAWLDGRAQLDWNGVAVEMANSAVRQELDIVVVDEAQDFSANQLRAIRYHTADDSATTFVIDTVQRIYARGFTWAETGFDQPSIRYTTLRENHRNTKQIAAFAAGLLKGMAVEADGALPDLNAASREGPLPVVLKGKYSKQVELALANISKNIDLSNESVIFLQPKGGGYFDFLRSALRDNNLQFVDITRETDWPTGKQNIALSTFHSAKGLEFDHVFIIGLSKINTEHDDSSRDDHLVVLRRLLAVAVARARESVTLGYKPGEESKLVDFFPLGKFKEKNC